MRRTPWLAVTVVCGRDDEEAARPAAPIRLAVVKNRTGRRAPIAGIEEALAYRFTRCFPTETRDGCPTSEWRKQPACREREPCITVMTSRDHSGGGVTKPARDA
jgi:hypothetical protein